MKAHLSWLSTFLHLVNLSCAVDIYHYISKGDTTCAGNYIVCINIAAYECCNSFVYYAQSTKVSGIDIYGTPDTVSSQRNAHLYDRLLTQSQQAVLYTGAASCGYPCMASAGGADMCVKGCVNVSGAMWTDDGRHPTSGRRGVVVPTRVREPDVAGFWDPEEGIHREVDVGLDVPANVSALALQAVGEGLGFSELEEVVRRYEVVGRED